ncbi:hypothetical protein SGLAM104S_09261 [Streptomyces glaucescens]
MSWASGRSRCTPTPTRTPSTRAWPTPPYEPGAAPADTYLRGDLIVRAALAASADAVHPGYGFLSENPGFARAVLDAGLVWIGPPPEAIEAMASKTRAKELLGITPLREVTEGDLPVLVKAAAGGGGRGMRVVRRLPDLEEELTAARAEALAAFGDDEVFVEPYVEDGRHVEVQILADTHGTGEAVRAAPRDAGCPPKRRRRGPRPPSARGEDAGLIQLFAGLARSGS